MLSEKHWMENVDKAAPVPVRAPLSAGFTDKLVANVFDGITPAKDSPAHGDGRE